MYRENDTSARHDGESTVEFVGGPYDGFLHVLSGDALELADEIAVPVSFNLILAAAGLEHGPLLPFRRLAGYQLCEQHGEWRFASPVRSSSNK